LKNGEADGEECESISHRENRRSGWGAAVVMGFLLHGAKVYGHGKEAYQQRPAYEINQQA
jgi:hypothetical protein